MLSDWHIYTNSSWWYYSSFGATEVQVERFNFSENFKAMKTALLFIAACALLSVVHCAPSMSEEDLHSLIKRAVTSQDISSAEMQGILSKIGDFVSNHKGTLLKGAMSLLSMYEKAQVQGGLQEDMTSAELQGIFSKVVDFVKGHKDDILNGAKGLLRLYAEDKLQGQAERFQDDSMTSAELQGIFGKLWNFVKDNKGKILKHGMDLLSKYTKAVAQGEDGIAEEENSLQDEDIDEIMAAIESLPEEAQLQSLLSMALPLLGFLG